MVAVELAPGTSVVVTVSEEVLLLGCVADPAPDPPAKLDSWANPTEAGVARNTEYTFFWSVLNINGKEEENARLERSNEERRQR